MRRCLCAGTAGRKALPHVREDRGNAFPPAVTAQRHRLKTPAEQLRFCLFRTGAKLTTFSWLFYHFQPPVQFHVPVLEITVDAIGQPSYEQRPYQPVADGGKDGFMFKESHFQYGHIYSVLTAQKRGKNWEGSKKKGVTKR